MHQDRRLRVTQPERKLHLALSVSRGTHLNLNHTFSFSLLYMRYPLASKTEHGWMGRWITASDTHSQHMGGALRLILYREQGACTDRESKRKGLLEYSLDRSQDQKEDGRG
jgi:hypothetical protein